MYSFLLFYIINNNYKEKISRYINENSLTLPKDFNPVPQIFKINKFILCIWHNQYLEGSQLPIKINPGLIAHSKKGFFLATGYLGKDMLVPSASDKAIKEFPCSIPEAGIFNLLQVSDNNLSLKDSPGGVSACLWINRAGTSAWVWSTQPPIASLFYAQHGEDYYVVSNRPLITYNAATLSIGHPRNKDYILDYITSSFSLKGDTLYPGVQGLLPNLSIQLAENKLYIRPYLLPLPEKIPQDMPLEQKGKLLANLLKESVWPATVLNSANVLLSGGKDSRTMLSAFDEKTDRKCVCVGADDCPESQVALKLAENLNLPLNICPQYIISNPLKAALVINRNTDGLGINFAHQYNFEYKYPVEPTIPTFHGHGHLLRGGFARTMKGGTEFLKDSVYKSFIPVNWINNDRINHYKKLVDRWIETRNADFRDERDILFYGQQDYRLGLFSTGAYFVLTDKRFMVYPLLDEKIARFAAGLCIFDRVSERVLFQALRILSPKVTELPLFGEIWRFDRSPEKTDFPDSKHNFQDGFAQRQPQSMQKMIFSQSKNFIYDEKGPDNKNKIIAELIMDSSMKNVLREYLKASVWAELESLVISNMYSKNINTLKTHEQLNFDSFIKRIFMGVSLGEFNF